MKKIHKIGDIALGKDPFKPMLDKQFQKAKNRFDKMSNEIGVELFDNMKNSNGWGILKGYEDMDDKKPGEGNPKLSTEDLKAIHSLSTNKKLLVSKTLAKSFMIDVSPDGKSFTIAIKGEPTDKGSPAYHVRLFEKYGPETPISKLKWQIKNKWKEYIKEIFKDRVIPGDKRKRS